MMETIQEDSYIDRLLQGAELIRQISGIKYEYNPRKLVFERDKLKLYHYQPQVKKPHAVPLLVVFATVNRPEILDLLPGQSFIRGLLDEGMDVYLLDWGYPDEGDQEISLDDYVGDYLVYCVKHIREAHQAEDINLLGICQGGLMCLCYTILFPGIKNLVLISTPVDFNTPDHVIAQILKRMDVDSLAAMPGNVSGAWLTQFFISLRPFELLGKKYLKFTDNLGNKDFVHRFLRVEKWLNDAPDQTGTSFAELVRNFYQGNKLVQGDIAIHGRKVDLTRLKVPVFNVIADQDEIVPPSASVCLKKYVQDYTQESFPSGHIGIYVSEKVGRRMTSAISKWLKQR